MRNGMFGGRLFLALGCSALLATAATADNWTRFRGPNGTGVTDDKDVPIAWNEQQGILWKVPLPGNGHGSPIVWGERLFVQSAPNGGQERLLLCLDAATGKPIWSKALPGIPAHIHEFNSWASSTPATDGERVYALFWDGKEIALHAFDLDGRALWHTGLGGFNSQHGVGQSPIVYEGKVVLANDQDGSATLVAVDARTGKLLWQKKRQAFRTCYSTPFILDKSDKGPELIVASTAGVTGYDPLTGAENWHWHWAFTSMALRTVSSPISADGLIFATSGDGSGARHTVAIKIGSKGANTRDNLVWEAKRDMPYVPSLLYRDEHLYFVTDKGMAGCLEARTGARVWFERLGSDMKASPLLIDGKVYAFGEDGEVYVFAAATSFKLLAHNTLGEPISATPAVANGRLFVRGKDHLFCIGKR